jgi:hypothetical protein
LFRSNVEIIESRHPIIHRNHQRYRKNAEKQKNRCWTC